MSLASGVNTVLTGVGNAVGATALGLKYIRDQAALYQKRQKFLTGTVMPTDVNVIDLFHKKIFKYVNFDGVLEYLKTKGFSTCKDIYTIHTLCYNLLPEQTEHAFSARNVKVLLGLYPTIIRLCLKHKKNLLVHIDLAGGEVHLITNVERFLTYVPLMPGVQLDDMDIPCSIALPQLATKQSNKNSATTGFKSYQHVSNKGSTVPTPVSFDLSGVSSGDHSPLADQQLNTSPLSQEQQPQQTGISDSATQQATLFSNTPEDSVHLLISKISLTYKDIETIADEDAFDALFFYTLFCNPAYNYLVVNYQNGAYSFDDLLFGLTSVVAKLKHSFKQLLTYSSGEYLRCVRKAAGVPDGNGTSNIYLRQMLLQIYAETFKNYLFLDNENNQRTLSYSQLLKDTGRHIAVGRNSSVLLNLVKAACSYTQGSVPVTESIFDLTLFRGMFYLKEFKQVMHSLVDNSIKSFDFCYKAESVLSTYGFSDFGRLVFYSSGVFGKSFRTTYGLAEGTGASNGYWMTYLQNFYKNTFGIEAAVKTEVTVDSVCLNLLTQLENRFQTQTQTPLADEINFDNLEQYNSSTL